MRNEGDVTFSDAMSSSREGNKEKKDLHIFHFERSTKCRLKASENEYSPFSGLIS